VPEHQAPEPEAEVAALAMPAAAAAAGIAGVLAAPPSTAQLLAIQRAAGNRATGRYLQAHGQRVLARGIDPPGTGWDGLQGGERIPRKLNPEMTKVATDYRTYLEATRNNRGMWAREAGTRAANFAGTAAERTTLYAELQRQIMQVHKSWGAVVRTGVDGSQIFYGSLNKTFTVDPSGRCWVGDLKKDFVEAGGQLKPLYENMRPIGEPSPVGGTGGGGPPAAGGGGGVRPGELKPAEGVKPEGVKPEGVKPAEGIKPSSLAKAPGRFGLRLASLARFIRGIGIQMIAMVILQLILDELERQRIEAMWDKDVQPALDQGVKDKEPQAIALAEKDPFFPVYHAVTVEIVYHGTKYRGGEVNKNVDSMRLIDVTPTTTQQDRKEIVKSENVDHPAMSTSDPFTRTSHLTFTVEAQFTVSHGEIVDRSAKLAVDAGTTARKAVEGRGWSAEQKLEYLEAYLGMAKDVGKTDALGGEANTVYAELEQERDITKRYGLATTLSAKGAAESGKTAREIDGMTHWGANDGDKRIKWVEAYIAITATRPEWQKLHDDALPFLDELKRTLPKSDLDKMSEQFLQPH
jgi:hypothetical protein